MINHPHLRRAEQKDILYIGANMRKADADEVFAATGESPYWALEKGLKESAECWTYAPHDIPCAMFGVTENSLDPKVGVVWLLGTDVFPRNKREIVKWTEPVIQEFFKNYDCLTNVIDPRNKVHLKWLLRSGFKIVAVFEKFGYEQRPFLQFMRTKNV